jgi:hypothetical protein
MHASSSLVLISYRKIWIQDKQDDEKSSWEATGCRCLRLADFSHFRVPRRPHLSSKSWDEEAIGWNRMSFFQLCLIFCSFFIQQFSINPTLKPRTRAASCQLIRGVELSLKKGT